MSKNDTLTIEIPRSAVAYYLGKSPWFAEAPAAVADACRAALAQEEQDRFKAERERLFSGWRQGDDSFGSLLKEYVFGRDGGTVAGTYGRTTTDREHRARFIAHAGEMAEMLEECADYYLEAAPGGVAMADQVRALLRDAGFLPPL